MSITGALAAGVPVPAALWLFYYRFKDRLKPEPWWLLARTFVFGMGSAFLAVAVYWALDRFGFALSEEGLGGPDAQAIPVAAMVGLVEETSKFLPVLLLVYRRPEFDEEFDGFVYAAVAALGFAAVENWFLLARMPNHILFVARAFVSPITHALISAPWGIGLAVEKLSGHRWAGPLGLVVAAACHGTFDLCLYRPVPVRFGSAAVILVLWAWMLWKSERQGRETPTSPTS